MIHEMPWVPEKEGCGHLMGEGCGHIGKEGVAT